MSARARHPGSRYRPGHDRKGLGITPDATRARQRPVLGRDTKGVSTNSDTTRRVLVQIKTRKLPEHRRDTMGLSGNSDAPVATR